MQGSGRAGRPGPKELSRDSRRLDRGLCKRRDGALIISLAPFPQRRATGGSRGAVVNTKSRLLYQKSFCKARAAQQQPRAARGTTTQGQQVRGATHLSSTRKTLDMSKLQLVGMAAAAIAVGTAYVLVHECKFCVRARMPATRVPKSERDVMTFDSLSQLAASRRRRGRQLLRRRSAKRCSSRS